MTTIELTPAEATAWRDVPEGGTFLLVRDGECICLNGLLPATEETGSVVSGGGPGGTNLYWTPCDHGAPTTPPAEFVQACAPCETCDSERKWSGVPEFPGCPDCRVELVGLCPNCRGTGRTEGGLCASCDGRSTVTLGWAYAVGQPLPIVRLSLDHGNIGCIAVDPASGTVWAGGKIITAALAHYGPPESLVGKWAVELRRA